MQVVVPPIQDSQRIYEDIFYLLDGTSNFLDKIKLGSKETRAYIAESFKELLARPDYEEILAALIPFGPPGRGDNIRALIESKEYL